MAYIPSHTDFNLSPYTGLTRESWIDAGIYLLKGVFDNIKSFDDPVVMPRKETDISYPHKTSSCEVYRQEQLAEIFEGLTRTFFISSVVIHERPDLVINGINLKDYYKAHVLHVVTPSDPLFVGSYESLTKMVGSKDPTRCYQQTVETAALVISLWCCKEEIWDTYTKEEKDLIASFLNGFANAATVPQNWRFFNMLSLAFLHMNGYPIDENIMIEHAQATLAYYVGDGWYRDGQCFDYYSCWAFNMYAPIWNLWYGYEHAPYIAMSFENNSNALMNSYADFFDKDGFTNMWGRSNIYRNAATSAFDGNLLLKHSTINPGLARRVTSGSLLQFITRDDLLYKGVPTLGFYGQFSPLVQGYSCAESPYWFGKAFMCLHFPKDHPFWTAREEGGTWDNLSTDEVKETCLNGPALCFTNHEANGETILRSSKVRKNKDDLHGMHNYAKLSYCSKFPWEATPKCLENNALFRHIESEMYTITDDTTGNILHGNVNLWHGMKKDVLYRRLFFDFDMNTENHWNQAINLADFPVSKGIIRADKLRLYRKPVTITLGSYGFPDNGTTIERVEKDGAMAIILKGKDSLGNPRNLAMTVFAGFNAIDLVHSEGTNPDSEKSIVIYATATRSKLYDSSEPYILISQVITSTDDKDFTEDELFPIESISYEDEQKTGAYGNVFITLKNGTKKVFDYSLMEQTLTL